MSSFDPGKPDPFVPLLVLSTSPCHILLRSASVVLYIFYLSITAQSQCASIYLCIEQHLPVVDLIKKDVVCMLLKCFCNPRGVGVKYGGCYGARDVST